MSKFVSVSLALANIQFLVKFIRERRWQKKQGTQKKRTLKILQFYLTLYSFDLSLSKHLYTYSQKGVVVCDLDMENIPWVGIWVFHTLHLHVRRNWKKSCPCIYAPVSPSSCKECQGWILSCQGTTAFYILQFTLHFCQLPTMGRPPCIYCFLLSTVYCVQNIQQQNIVCHAGNIVL